MCPLHAGLSRGFTPILEAEARDQIDRMQRSALSPARIVRSRSRSSRCCSKRHDQLVRNNRVGDVHVRPFGRDDLRLQDLRSQIADMIQGPTHMRWSKLEGRGSFSHPHNAIPSFTITLLSTVALPFKPCTARFLVSMRSPHSQLPSSWRSSYSST